MKKIHIIGIGGSGVSGVSRLAEKMGYEVTGCDLEASTAYAKNIFQGHDVGHIKDVDLVIASPAVFYQNSTHPEFGEAKKRGILITWQEFLGKYLHTDKKVICVAGTHGKSTTTAMAGKLLEDAGLDPLVLVGANISQWEGNSKFGKGDYFVTEADEFFDNFLHYHPEIIILNNIEFDHPDYFKDEEAVFESFKKFIGNLKGEKILIANRDSEGVNKILQLIPNDIKVIKYSLSDENVKLNLKVPGKHNVANALGVIKLGEVLGIEKEIIKKSLEGFIGIGRRLELIGTRNGVKVYDDYAHHPTAIAATLQGMREIYPTQKIWVVVEPHGYDRTHSLLSLYKGVFELADNVIIGPIFKARDTETFGITPDSVAEASNHEEIVGVDSFEEIKKIISQEVKKGDIVLVMGAGKSYMWAREILESLGKVSFKDLTTFRVGGEIKHYKEVKNKEELINAIHFAKENKLPIFILGEGSDILVNDKDFEGVVVKYTGKSIAYAGNVVTAEAGMNWDSLVENTIKNNLQGMECLSGIPGTVGASPIQDIGAYGQELKDVFETLTAYDIEKEKFVTFSKEDCEFGYRESFFKRKENWQKYVICDVAFKLNENRNPDVQYDSLKNYLAEKGIDNPTLQEVRDAVLVIREGKFENPKEVGNAGSFFKNPIIDTQKKKELESKYPEIPLRDQGDGTYKSSAAWFIETAGWKGKTYKTAGVSPKHALILINPKGDAEAKDLMELSRQIIEDVENRFGVKLEREVQLINF